MPIVNHQSKQITNRFLGVVVDVAQLLVHNVLTQSLAHSHASQLRYQIAKLLINLTFRSVDCKKTLCLQENFVKTVCMLINEGHELVRVCAF